jgi:hypothetical protein
MTHLTGCSSEMSPLGPELDKIGSEITPQPVYELEEELEDDARDGNFYPGIPKNLEILSFGNVVPSLMKKISTSENITYDKGGKLKIDCKIPIYIDDGDDDDDDYVEMDMKIELKIHKKSIDVDEADVGMSIDSDRFHGDMDVIFGPHGLKFSKPANLDIEVKHIDLSQLGSDNLSVYYYNGDTGNWEKMNVKKIKVEKKKDGKIKVEKAELPHFSRYALCKG